MSASRIEVGAEITVCTLLKHLRQLFYYYPQTRRQSYCCHFCSLQRNRIENILINMDNNEQPGDTSNSNKSTTDPKGSGKADRSQSTSNNNTKHRATPEANSNTHHRNNSINNSIISNTMNEDSHDVEGGDDVGWWDCSLCTYRNSADKFKCDICDLRRGTSTRKPRNNAETIVAQVLKQQEQIRQQTVVKTPKSRPSRSSLTTNPEAASSSSAALPTITTTTTSSSSASKPPKSGKKKSAATIDDAESLGSPAPPKRKKAKRTTTTTNREEDEVSDNEGAESDGGETANSDATEATDDLDRTLVMDSESESEPFSSSSRASSPSPATSSPVPLKLTPIEVNGNLIKYSAPTSRGRTGLIIDKKRFSQHSVTINDVTITFTEFATRQNRYIRKKKRQRTNNGKSRVKNATAANTNST